MRKKTLVLSLLLACATAFGQSSYDLVIVGIPAEHLFSDTVLVAA